MQTILNEQDGIDKIATLALDRKLVPVFGSGFTRGCKSHKEKVPDGKEATMCMKNLILSNVKDITESDLDELSFNEMSNYFLKLLPHSIISEFFIDYFSKVNITGYKKELLDLDWQYAYTLNVDDGIENSSDFKAVLPYKNLENPKTSIKLLYKLHGDAFTEATSLDTDKNIVFSSEQYIVSLTDPNNVGILNNLEADYSSSNMLFIGCSLINEPDIKFIFDKVNADDGNSLRIVVRKDSPKSLKERMLLDSYGINTVIVIDDYDLFYQKLVSEIRKKLSERNSEDFKFKNTQIKVKLLKKDTIELLSGINILDENANAFLKGGMHFCRQEVNQVEALLKTSNCIVIKGRRFSGKTHILASICERQKKYTTFFFPSNSIFDELLILQLLSKYKGSLFLFDSNSLSNNAYMLIANSRELLNENQNKIILASNSNDTFLADMLDAECVEFNGYLDEIELKPYNVNADKYALSRRRIKQTNLDYLNLLAKEQKIAIKMLKDYDCKLTKNEQKLLLLLVVFDKVLFGDAIALRISHKEIVDFVKKFPRLIENVETDAYEKASHSTHKLVHNGKMLLLDKLNELSKEEIRDAILDVVKHFKNDKLRYRVHIDLILFDTLNQLFGGKKGAGHLIYFIYESLEEHLCNDLHYWLQRSKSIYRLRPNDPLEMHDAYSFAKKVYLDAHGKLFYQSALSLALISAKLTFMERDIEKKIQTAEEALSYAKTAIFSEYYFTRKKYLQSELQTSKNKNNLGALGELCNEYMRLSPDGNYKNDAEKIIIKLESLKNKL